MRLKGDLLLTDPLYIIRNGSGNDWKRLLSEGYDHAALHLLGITRYLSGEIGDDSVRNVIDNNGMKIGSFCSDSALFCVCDLKQALAYNPDFFHLHDKCPDCFCVIHDFDGEIYIVQEEKKNNHVMGIGNNGFRTQEALPR